MIGDGSAGAMGESIIAGYLWASLESVVDREVPAKDSELRCGLMRMPPVGADSGEEKAGFDGKRRDEVVGEELRDMGLWFWRMRVIVAGPG